MNSDFAVLPCPTVEAANAICNSIPETDVFITVWDKGHLLNENT